MKYDIIQEEWFELVKQLESFFEMKYDIISTVIFSIWI